VIEPIYSQTKQTHTFMHSRQHRFHVHTLKLTEKNIFLFVKVDADELAVIEAILDKEEEPQGFHFFNVS
jgi:hypothetical protein